MSFELYMDGILYENVTQEEIDKINELIRRRYVVDEEFYLKVTLKEVYE